MAKVKILVVEDEAIIAMQLSDILEDIGYEVLPVVSDYESAVEHIKRSNPDIALLDININGEKSGIDIGRYITNHGSIPFIFLTSLVDQKTVGQAIELKPNAYLVKPFSRDDLYTSIELALLNFSAKQEDSEVVPEGDVSYRDAFFVKLNNSYTKVPFEDIVYAHSHHVYMELYTLSGKMHLLRSTLAGMMEQLPNSFFQTNRSNVINLNYLEKINQTSISLQGSEVPISKSARTALLLQLES